MTSLDLANLPPRNPRVKGVCLDIGELERVVARASRVIRMQELNAPEGILQILRQQAGVDERPELYKELRTVICHPETYGYRIDHIPSGKPVVILTSVKHLNGGTAIMEDIGEFESEAAACEYAEKNGIKDHLTFEEDRYDWWAIIDSEGKNATQMVYPTRERAVVFLMRILWDQLPEWRRIVKDMYNRHAAEQKSDPNVVNDFVMDIKNGEDTSCELLLFMRGVSGKPYPNPELMKKAFEDVRFAYTHLDEFGCQLDKINSGTLRYSVLTCDCPDDPEDFDTVGVYDTPAEAQAACVTGKEKIEPYDPEERYALMTPDNRNLTGELYTSEGEAIAYILDAYRDRFPNWHEWRLLDTGYDEQMIRYETRVAFENAVMAKESKGAV